MDQMQLEQLLEDDLQDYDLEEVEDIEDIDLQAILSLVIADPQKKELLINFLTALLADVDIENEVLGEEEYDPDSVDFENYVA